MLNSTTLQSSDELAVPVPGDRRRVLIADDSRSQCVTIGAMLKKWGYEVCYAADGQEALAVFKQQPFSIVISDWMMPGLSGPELCSEIRKIDRDDYAYFILLTSKTDTHDVVEGLGAGADDYLIKPVDGEELLARLRTGERILSLQNDLKDKHETVVRAHAALSKIHAELEQDLRVAAGVQKSCIPCAYAQCGGLPVASLFKPCNHVSGDLMGYFELGEHEIAAYSIDVSGHGVAAALMAVSLSQMFNRHDRSKNVAFEATADGVYQPLAPHDVASRLNEEFQGDSETNQYFTMVFARIDTRTGAVSLCQAGHQNPAVLRSGGSVELAGDGGLPIGLMPRAEFETVALTLMAGDGLLLYSDGIVDCLGKDGKPISQARVMELIATARAEGLPGWDSRLLEMMCAETGSDRFEDDLSALLIAFDPAA